MNVRNGRPLAGAVIVSSCSLAILAVGAAEHAAAQDGAPADSLIAQVRTATAAFQDVAAAEAEGWTSTGACASGPDFGAMGVHYVNAELLMDGQLDVQRPEALMYAPAGDGVEFLGVEYIVIAEDWHANNEAPPVLNGQLFNYNPSPNRFGLPAFYALHVWAWRENPNGSFANWNPDVKCDEYVAEAAGPPDEA
ncbi:MAG TPA: hypothetical protein VK025_01960 [Steroidobacter sp.]|jgi:hypothetical protein|nr:hypothetical protein [Steroidobacteraceae bacterium]HLS80152.1 hypothetical protein [Steroidobacter sp.]